MLRVMVPTHELPRLRVVSWNVLNGSEAISSESRAQAAADVLADVRPDLLLLQESWPGLPEFLSRRLGLVVASEHLLSGGSHCAVLVPARAELLASGSVSFVPGGPLGPYGAASALVVLDGVRLAAASAHLPWGADEELERLRAVAALDRHLAEAEAEAALFGADMNTTPAAECFRFLRGEVPFEGATTFYVDAAAACAVDVPTQVPRLLPLSEGSARRAGIDLPHLLPARRLDVVMCRGWVHGRLLSPLSAEVLMAAAAPVSDHAPVRADLLWR